MDNYEYNIKSDQIKKLYSKRDYSTAAKVADGIDWRRVKNNSMLNLVADVYDRCKEYEKARDVLLIAYDRTTCGRQLAYKLTILSLRLKDFVEADEFYKDFVDMAPEDTAQYILKYRIAKTKGEHIDVLISILEAYAEVEMDERWQCELAKLYDEAGRKEDCIAMCDQIILWFSEGKYVERAMELKMKYEPLTKEQQEKYDNRLSVRESLIEDAPAAVPVDESVKTAENESVQEVVSEESKQYKEDIKQLDKEMYGNKNTVEFYDFIDSKNEKLSKIGDDLMKTAEIDIDEINFKAMNISDYDTANIQAAIAKSMEIIMKESAVKKPEVQAEVKEEPMPEESHITAEELNKAIEEPNKAAEESNKAIEEPLQETTKEIPKVVVEDDIMKTKPIDSAGIRKMLEKTEEVEKEAAISQDTSEATARSAFEQPSEEEERIRKLMDEARINIMKEHLDKEKEESKKENIYHTVPLSPLYEQESDGQIGIAKPEEADEQIEGQMTIEEILHEYEIRSKYEAALAEVAKYEAEIKKQEERRKAREAALIEEFAMTAQEDDLSDDNDEHVSVEETGESDWIENPKEPEYEDPNAPKQISEQEELVNALFGEIPEDEKESVSEEKETEIPSVSKVLAGAVLPQTRVPVFGETTIDYDKYSKSVTEDSASKVPEESSEEPVKDEKAEEPSEEPVKGEKAEEPSEEPVKGEKAEEPSEEPVKDEKAEEPSEEPIKDEKAEEPSEKSVKEALEEAGKVEVQNRDEEELGKIKLNDEYRPVFADFLDLPGLEEQLVRTIDNLINDFEMDGTSKNNNVLIMGDVKTGKTTLALGIIKVANRGRGNGRPGRKVAKIKAEVFNKKGVTSALPKILGADLIIEKAGNLTPTTVIDLIEIMKTYTEEMLVVMEDDKSAIERLVNTTPELRQVFNNKIYIKGYDADDYVRMAKDYAAKKKYVVNEMGTLALYARVGDIYGRNGCVTKEELEDIIDEAISHAEHGGLIKLLGKMKRNKDEFGILKEEDFI